MVLLFVAPLMGLTGDQVAVQCLTFCLSLGMDTLQGAGEKEKYQLNQLIISISSIPSARCKWLRISTNRKNVIARRGPAGST